MYPLVFMKVVNNAHENLKHKARQIILRGDKSYLVFYSL